MQRGKNVTCRYLVTSDFTFDLDAASALAYQISAKLGNECGGVNSIRQIFAMAAIHHIGLLFLHRRLKVREKIDSSTDVAKIFTLGYLSQHDQQGPKGRSLEPDEPKAGMEFCGDRSSRQRPGATRFFIFLKCSDWLLLHS